jgi:alpha-amylase/alpha-mannosidase (GH57 family)
MDLMPNHTHYICIHGHFYQPPRENPWLEQVETQDSAAPFHDWNERITSECYAPNGASRIVNQNGEIIRILNNYAHISFNFGPTLLSWLETCAPRTYRMILDADHVSQKRFSGHGSAMAQVYNHMIMPLASRRDKITQIRWGIADFERRFGRRPEGMWLAETAVDSETLELLADHGILFTVLAPHQCARVRPLTKENSGEWTETQADTLDTHHPYLIRLKTGKTIAIFFYDGPRSRAVAFEGLLNSGETFAGRLLGGFAEEDTPQLVHIATDGESYGHHHKQGEMALAYALKLIEQSPDASLINYGEFLQKFPPTWEAEIVENTSWSCLHGIERWRSNCGCNAGHPGWNQEWRGPLREALDWLRDAVAPMTEATAKPFFKNVWAARDAYISVLLDRAGTDDFLAKYATRELNAEERITALKLMELQRHALLMYTSCGWFFDEISGIETTQIIAYAARVLQLAAQLFGPKGAALEEHFIEILGRAKSNLPQEGDGASIYLRRVGRLKVGLEQVAAHYAISSLFSNYPDEATLFCYSARRLAYEVVTSGRSRLLLGQARITSQITEESQSASFAVVHFGDQNINAVVQRYDESQSAKFAEFAEKARAAVTNADFPELVRLFDRTFSGPSYSIQSLFKDEQRRILNMILQPPVAEVESSLIAIYEGHASLLHFLSKNGFPKPPALELAADFAVNAGLRRAIDSDPIDALQVRTWLRIAATDQIVLDSNLLRYITDLKMKRVMVALQTAPERMELLDDALLTARTLTELPFDLNLWQAQNIWYDVLRLSRNQDYPQEWKAKFHELGAQMKIVVDELVVEEATNGVQHEKAESAAS